MNTPSISDIEPAYGAMNADGWIPARPILEYALGVDLGQSFDPTSLCLLEHRRDPILPVGADLIQKLTPSRYIVRHLSRVALGTSYVAIARIVGGVLARPEIRRNCELVIDRTGVGRAVADIFTQAGLSFTGVTITSGDGEKSDGEGGYRVGKLSLVSRLQAEFHSKSLRLPKDLPEAGALVTELQNFRATISDAGHATFGARVGAHDDLVLSLALALWYFTHGGAWTTEPLAL
jgi:hypothetical protein